MSEELTPRTMADAAEYAKNQEPLHNVYETSDFAQGIARGRFLAEQRIIKLLEELDRHGSTHSEFCAARHAYAAQAIALIKGENKASHTHEIVVSGAPCDCEAKGWNVCVCDGIEPCEPEGENK